MREQGGCAYDHLKQSLRSQLCRSKIHILYRGEIFYNPNFKLNLNLKLGNKFFMTTNKACNKHIVQITKQVPL